MGWRLALLAATALVLAGAAHARGSGLVHRRLLLGHSVEGRPIVAIESGNPSSGKNVLVVSCIHGNECAGVPVAQRLASEPPPRTFDLWIVPNLNPDGAARDTRSNAHGVDLNRNFPWQWQPLGGVYDSGPHPLSEPESRMAFELIERLHPAISIWFHQHLGVVDDSGGSVAIERRFSRRTGLPLATLAREPGSATTWQNHAYPHATAFVVELHAGSLARSAVTRFAQAVLAVSE